MTLSISEKMTVRINILPNFFTVNCNKLCIIENSEEINLKFKIIGKDLAEREFNIALPTENMNEAMSLLSKTTKTSVTKEGNQFIIQAKTESDKNE